MNWIKDKYYRHRRPCIEFVIQVPVNAIVPVATAGRFYSLVKDINVTFEDVNLNKWMSENCAGKYVYDFDITRKGILSAAFHSIISGSTKYDLDIMVSVKFSSPVDAALFRLSFMNVKVPNEDTPIQ